MMGQSASTDQADILGSHTTTSNTANRTSIVTDNSHTELKAQLQCDGKGMKTCLELVLSMKNGKSAGVEPSTETDEQKVKPESRGDGGEPNLSQDGTPAEQQQQKQPSDPPTPTSSEKDTADMKIGKSDANDQNKSKLSDDAKRLVFNKNANLHDAIGALIRNCITETKFSPDHAQHNSSETKQTKEATGNVQSDKKISMNAPSYKNYESNTVDNAWRAPGGYYQNHQPMLVGQKQGAVSEISETVAPSPKSWKGSGELARNGNQSSKPLMPKDKMHPSPESVARTTGTGGQSVVQLQAFIDKCLENTWQQQKVGMSEKLTTIGKGQFNYGSEVTPGDQHQQHTARNGHPEEVCIQSERAPAVQQMYHPNMNQVAYYSEMAKQDRTSNGLDPSSMRKEINDSRYIHSFQPSNKGMIEGIRDIRQQQQHHQQPQHPQSHSQQQQQQQQQYYTGSEMAAAALNQTYSNMMAQMHPGSSKSNPHSAGDGFESAFDAKELINKISCQARAINKFFSNSGEPAELSYHSSKMGQHPAIKVNDQQQADYANKNRSMHSPASSPSHMMNRSQENPLGSLSNHKRMMYEDGRGISYMERLNHATTGKELQQHNMSPNYRQHKEDTSNMMSDMHHLQASVAPGQRLQGDMQQRVARLNQQQQQDIIIRSSQPGIMSKYSESMVAHQMYGQKDHSADRMSHYQTSPGGSMSSVTGNTNNTGGVSSSPNASHAKTMERMLAAPHQQPHYMQTPGGGIIKWDDHASLNARYHQISPQSVKMRGASNASMPSPQEGDVLITMASSKNHSPRTHSNSSQSGGMLTPSFMSPSSSPLIHHKDGAASGTQKLQAHYMDSLGKPIGSAPGDSSLRGSAAATAGGMVPQRRHTVSDMANYSSEPSKLQHASMRPLSAPDAAVISAATAVTMPATMVGRKPRVEGENVLDLSVKRKAGDGHPIAAGSVPGVVASSSAPQSASNQESPLDLSKKKPEEQFLMMSGGGSRGCEIISPGSSFHAAATPGGAGKSVPANILLKHLEYSVQKYCSNIGGGNPSAGAASLGPNMHQGERVTPQSAAGAPQTNPLHHHQQQQQQQHAQPHLLTAQQHHQPQGAHPPHHPPQQQHYQQHHPQTQQQHHPQTQQQHHPQTQQQHHSQTQQQHHSQTQQQHHSQTQQQHHSQTQQQHHSQTQQQHHSQTQQQHHSQTQQQHHSQTQQQHHSQTQQQHHSQTQQQHQAYQKQGLAASQMMMSHQQARSAELSLHPTSQYISSRKDFPHGYIMADSHHRQSQQSYPIFRQPTLPALPKHGPHLQSQQQQPQQQPQPQQQQQQPQSQPVVQPQAYQLSPVAAPAATQNVSAYPPQNMEPAQNNHRSSKSANSTNEKLDNNCSKKHDISKHEPVQNLLGNHAADDVLYLICKLCGQTYGSPYSFRKHFRNQHGFEPRPHHTVVQSISATISLLKGKPPEANVMVKNEDALQAKSVSNPGSVADSRVDIKKIEIEDQKFDVDLCTATNSSSFKINPEEAASQNRNPLENPLSSQEETKFLECPECGKQFQLNDFGSYKKHCRSHERNKHGGGISEYAFEMSSQMWKRNLPADTEGRQCSSVPTPETISKERCPSDSGSSISVDRVLRPSSYSFDTPKSDMSSQSSTAGSQNDNSNDTCKDYPLLSIHDIKQENDPYAGQLNKTSESQWSRTCIKTEAKCVDSKDGEQPPVITDDPWYPSDDSSDEHRLKIVMSELDEGSSVSVKKEDNQDTDLTSDKSYSHNMDSSESFCDQSNTSEPSITNVTSGGQPGAPSAGSLADSNSNSSLKKQSDIASECDKPEVDNEDDETFTYRHKKFQKFGSQLKRKDSNATDSQDSAVDSKRKKVTEVG